MKAEKSLQKVTKSEININKILSLKQITRSDLETLSETEKARLNEVIDERFRNLEGEEHDSFCEKIWPITSPIIKNQLWEYNHNRITATTATLMQEYGRMPSKSEIAVKTKLSRQTIHKHFQEYSNHPQYLGQIDQFKFLTSKVLAKVYYFAVNGDMSAAKLYFKMMGCMDNEQATGGTLIQNQNNFIQINGTVLSQDTIKHLNTEQLNTIEGILKIALPQAEVLEVRQS